MRKVLGGILLVVYSIIAITVTVLLLSYNEYNCSEIGGYTVYIVNDDSLEPDYKQGSILLIKGTNDKNVQIGDEMFLYKVINSQEYEFVNRTLVEKEQQGRHITYVVENEEKYANDYFVGKASDTVVIEGWGYVLGLLESKWGYLFCVVIVSLLLFLQEVFELIMEIKYGGGKADNNANTKNAVEVESSVNSDSARNTGNVKNVTARTATRTGAKRSTSKSSSSTTKTSAGKENASTGKTATGVRKTSTAKTASNTTKKTTTAGATKKVAAVKDNNEANVEEE